MIYFLSRKPRVLWATSQLSLLSDVSCTSTIVVLIPVVPNLLCNHMVLGEPGKVMGSFWDLWLLGLTVRTEEVPCHIFDGGKD